MDQDKQTLLQNIKQALLNNVVTSDEIRAVIAEASPVQQTPQAEQKRDPIAKLSAVEIMFYIVGIVLFAAIMSVIVQSWENGNPVIHILLSAGIGVGLWGIGAAMAKQPSESDTKKGLENAMILTGSLCIIVGGYIITNELIGGFDDLNYIPGAITLAILGALHIAYDRLIHKDLVILLGLLLLVGSVPALLFGLLQGQGFPADFWSFIAICSLLILATSTRSLAVVDKTRKDLSDAFDPLVAFLVLGIMFCTSFSDYGLVWLVALVLSVFGLFYISIVRQSKDLLGSASLFLIISVLTISFKYFSGFGASISLIIAAIGLFASAVFATSINKRYFKKQVAVDNV